MSGAAKRAIGKTCRQYRARGRHGQGSSFAQTVYPLTVPDTSTGFAVSTGIGGDNALSDCKLDAYHIEFDILTIVHRR